MNRISSIVGTICVALSVSGAARGEVTLNSVRVTGVDTVALAMFYQSAFGMREVNRIDVPGDLRSS